MKTKTKPHSSLFFMLFFISSTRIQVSLSDCDNLQDTCPAEKKAIFINGLPCKDQTNIAIAAHEFKTSELSKPSPRDKFGASIKMVTVSELPGLNTLGLSIGRTDLEVDGLVNFHAHPRATEMIFVKEGVLFVGFLDTQNQIFQKLVRAGDVFVVPKGLFHFLLNRGGEVASVVSVFNSQNPGMESLTAVTSDSTLDSVEKLKRKFFSVFDDEVRGDNDLSSEVLDIIYD